MCIYPPEQGFNLFAGIDKPNFFRIPTRKKGFNASFVDGSVRKMEIPDNMTYGRGSGNRHDPFFQKYCYRNFNYQE